MSLLSVTVRALPELGLLRWGWVKISSVNVLTILRLS